MYFQETFVFLSFTYFTDNKCELGQDAKCVRYCGHEQKCLKAPAIQTLPHQGPQSTVTCQSLGTISQQLKIQMPARPGLMWERSGQGVNHTPAENPRDPHFSYLNFPFYRKMQTKKNYFLL